MLDGMRGRAIRKSCTYLFPDLCTGTQKQCLRLNPAFARVACTW